ncbi:glucose dehydrogenase [FAD, quinone]-like [Diorhabda carinulata]|uniref:glucose dehydrogenase [FAD, quinone]-like n=1 Tax=Diorhabda carinulata TaxID=1163345 RepID=UPI0025A1DDF9|nr:glucose dehydrogenase [FAD, quinone]-like [Diorhabda carinulata]
MMLRSSVTLLILGICKFTVKADFSPFDIVDEYVKQFRSGIGSLCQWSDTYKYEQKNYEKSTFNNTLALGDAEEYDFVIVGGGTAGLTLAHRLSEEPRWKILVLEAGGLETPITEVPAMQPQLQTTGYTWGYKTCAQKHACLGSVDNKCLVVKGKALGGDTAINDLLYTRGHPRDYDIWADSGMRGWCWENVLPYFRKIEDACVEDMDKKFRHYGGPIHLENLYPSDPILAEHFLEAGLECGLDRIDYNGRDHIGLGLPQVITKQGKRHSVAKAYLKPILQRKNLVLLPNSQVVEVLISDITKEANGVAYIHDGKVFLAKATKEVILSAGAINSAQLLMLSGVGPKEDLKHFEIEPIADLAVGKQLKDQVSFVGLNFVYDPLHVKHAIEDSIQSIQTVETSDSIERRNEHDSKDYTKENNYNSKSHHNYQNIKDDYHHKKDPAIEIAHISEGRFHNKNHRFIPQIGKDYESEFYHKHGGIKDENNETSTVSKLFWINDSTDEEIIKYLRYGKGSLSTTGLQLVGYIKTEFSRDSTAYPDVQILIKKTHPKGGCYHFKGANLRKDLHDIFCKAYEGFNVEIVLLRPKSQGYLKLDDVDPYHQPYINPNALGDEDEYDVQTLLAGIRKVINMINGPAMQKLGVKLVKEKIPECDQAIFNDEYWKCAIKYMSVTRGQITGTAKMGLKTEKDAVVDEELKVYGVNKLRVADASVIPVSISGNVMAPEIMIAEKAADILKKCWMV